MSIQNVNVKTLLQYLQEEMSEAEKGGVDMADTCFSGIESGEYTKGNIFRQVDAIGTKAELNAPKSNVCTVIGTYNTLMNLASMGLVNLQTPVVQ